MDRKKVPGRPRVQAELYILEPESGEEEGAGSQNQGKRRGQGVKTRGRGGGRDSRPGEEDPGRIRGQGGRLSLKTDMSSCNIK